MERPRLLTVIRSLALVQGFIAILVALIWLGIASLFSPDSAGITSPLIVMIAQAKGGLLVVLALMFLVFAVGARGMHAWAWWVGLLASLVSILYVVRLVVEGAPIVMGLFVVIIPLVIVWYLLSPMSREIFVR